MTVDALLDRVRGDDWARLRWHLCRLFGVAPWSRLGRALGDEECLLLAAQLVLDRAGTELPAGGSNPNFDAAAFLRRKGAAV